MLVLEFAAAPHPGLLPVKYGEREKQAAAATLRLRKPPGDAV